MIKRLDMVFLILVVFFAGVVEAQPIKSKYKAIERMTHSRFEGVYRAAKDFKERLADANTSLVLAAKVSDTNAVNLSRKLLEVDTVSVETTIPDVDVILEAMTADLGENNESYEKLKRKFDFLRLHEELEKLFSAVKDSNLELYVLTFEDWQAHTTLKAVALYDLKNGEGLMIGFTHLAW
jgi:hypothetical protein